MAHPARTTWILLALTAVAGVAVILLDVAKPPGGPDLSPAGRLLGCSAGEVTALDVEEESLSVGLERTEDGWRLVSPVNAVADSFRVEQIVEALTAMPRGRALEPDGADPGALGLDPPRAVVTVTARGTVRRMAFGRNAPIGSDVYLQIDGDPFIRSTRSRVPEILPTSLAGWRDRTLFTGTPDQIRRIEVQRREGPLHLARLEGGGWRMERPSRGRTEQARVDVWLMTLLGFRVTDFVAESLAAATLYGLDEPEARITLYSADDPGGQTVLIGRAVEDTPDLHYAARRNGTEVFTVPNALLAEASQPVDAFRQRQLLEVDPEAVQALVIEDGRDRVVLERDPPTSAWMLTSPKRAPADPDRVASALEAVASARVLGFLLPESGAPDDTTGLAPPRRAVRLSTEPLNGGEPPATDLEIRLGAPAPEGRVHASVPGEESVLLIEADLLAALPAAALPYRSREVLVVRPGELRGIRLTRAGGVTGVDFDAAGPIPFPAQDHRLQRDRLDAVLALLTRLTATSLVEEDPDDLGIYGLDQPFASLQLILSGTSGISKTLSFGHSPGAPDDVYVLVLGTDVVFTLPDDVTGTLLTPLAEPIARPEPVPDEPAPSGTEPAP